MVLNELSFYDPTPDDRCGDFERHLDVHNCWGVDLDDNDTALFEVVFDVHTHRYYCYITARSIVEALGVFFMEHPHISYDDILDHGCISK